MWTSSPSLKCTYRPLVDKEKILKTIFFSSNAFLELPLILIKNSFFAFTKIKHIIPFICYLYKVINFGIGIRK